MRTLRHAWRSLGRAPAFAIGATAVFALGVGINAAVFSSVDRMIFRPLPYRDANRLFMLQEIDVESGQNVTFLPARYVLEAGRQIDAIEAMAYLGDSSGFFETPVNDGLEIRLSFVTANMLDIGGVVPILGRGFTAEDERLRREVALVTYEGWQARFGGDPDILSRRVYSRVGSLQIIGVLPPGYIPSGALLDPTAIGVALMTSPELNGPPTSRTLPPTIRLKAGVSLQSAQAALDALIARLTPEMPRERGGPKAFQLVPLRRAMFGRYAAYLWLVMAGAGLVLLGACANLAGLFLVRSRSRLRDTAVRLSLGASRTRIMGDGIAEATLICLAGAAAALLALRWSMSWLQSVLPPIFGQFSAGVDARVIAFAFIAAGAAGLFTAILPALLIGGDVWRITQGGAGPLGSGSSRRGRWLLAVEAALGIVLVAGAGLTARNFIRLSAPNLGFDPIPLHLILVRSSAATPREQHADLQRALEIVRGTPGVAAAAAGAPLLPILQSDVATPFAANGPPCCRWQVTGDYTKVLNVDVLAGRELTDIDAQTHASVGVLNESALRYVWPGVRPEAAVGRILNLEGDAAREIVGVVADTRRGYMDDNRPPGLYVPIVDDPFRGMLIVARTEPGATLLVSDLRPRIETSQRALYYVRPMAPMYARVLEAPRFRAVLFGIFGAIALVIAMVGLYALTSFEVANRRRELGVRMTLGASRLAIQRMVLVDSSKPVVVGVIIGLGVAIWAGPFLQAFLHNFSARDPWTLAGSAVALIAVGGLAAWQPAWRASRIDPAVVLRTE
jgi:putative ABC transport system permease protein